MTHNTTLQLCDKPYPFATIETETELTVKEKILMAAIGLGSVGMFALTVIGAITVWRWL